MKIENCLTQTDPRWGSIDMINQIKIKDSGCLNTSVVNALRDYSTDYREYMTPLRLDSFLDRVNGYTREGSIIWAPLEKFFHFTHERFITPHAKPTFSNDPKKYWIVQVPYKNTGHFCNVLSVHNDSITYFDVYDGVVKAIEWQKTISIRQLTFA